MKLLAAVKRVIDFGVRPGATRIVAAAAAVLFGASPAAAQDAETSNLAEFRRHVDFPACGFTLSNGVRIEFAGLHAIERGRRVFHKLVVFGVPGVGPAPVGMRVSTTGGTPRYVGHVVRNDQTGTYFEFPHPVLERFTRAGGLRIVAGFSRPGPVVARIARRSDRDTFRAIADGQSCYQDALDTD